jgi:DNA-binding transcriptional ArsR family regulator
LTFLALYLKLKSMLDLGAVDRVFHALADPSRRAMVERLSRGPASVKELAAPLAMSLAAVVQHVQVLEQSGVIRTEKVGRVRSCRLDPAGLNVAERWIVERRALWERRLDRLGDLLAEPEPSREPRAHDNDTTEEQS